VGTFALVAFGLTKEQAGELGDEAVGRALGQLFDADRGSLLTEIVLAVTERFALLLEGCTTTRRR
jgi:hypothetical protein